MIFKQKKQIKKTYKFKKQMKVIKTLIVLTLIFGVLTLNSCKKKDPAPSATITATVGGTATAFNIQALAAKGTANGVTFTTIQGISAAGDTLSIALNGTVTAGKTYSAVAGGSDTEPLLILTSKTDQFMNDDNSTTNLVSVTINSVSSSTVAGTFTGDLASNNITIINGVTTQAKKSVTNGKFSVSF
jgi:hypothetical protein